MAKTTRSGAARYGFRWKDGAPEIEPEEAHIRKLAFELFVEHRKKMVVANQLNERGFRTRRGKNWSGVGVMRLLNCPSVCGRYPVGNAEGEQAEDFIPCDSIVSQELWDQVQEILADQASSPSSKPTGTVSQIFAGFTFCECGSAMSVPSKSPKFVCSSCDTKIPIIDLERLVCQGIRQYLQKREKPLGAHLGPSSELVSERSKVSAEINSKQEQLGRLEQLYIKGQIDPDRFADLSEPIKEALDVLQAKEGKLTEKIKKSESNGDSPQTTLKRISFFLDHWNEVPSSVRRDIVVSLVDRLVVRQGGHLDPVYKLFVNSPLEAPAGLQMEKPTNPKRVELGPGEPEYIPVPKPGKTCPYSGLKRGKVYELITPFKEDGGDPLVESIKVAKDTQSKGTRLILWASLKAYLKSKE